MSSKPTFSPSARVIIQDVIPEIQGGLYPAKRVVGETCQVKAVIFADGHDELFANLMYRKTGESSWQKVAMKLEGNDLWQASFTPDEVATFEFTIEAWIDHYQTWKKDLLKRLEAGQELKVEFQIGLILLERVQKRANQRALQDKIAEIQKAKKLTVAHFDDSAVEAILRAHPDPQFVRTYGKNLQVRVQRKKALFSSWYELFPRSASGELQHGRLLDLIPLLPKIDEMGYNVLYFPPIHPIGQTNRKGKNNTKVAGMGDHGSPWAIGAKEGGHDAIHPLLGTFEDLAKLRQVAERHGLELALDLALQCSPDHPYVKKQPEWFLFRPDGSVQFAENPPKKYEDIIPFHFETTDYESLWQEWKRVVLFWVDQGIRIFRVDNPHTKPFVFWHWLIREVHAVNPTILFLSEAFTRPHVMKQLSKIGFDQSYTYFTWRNSKQELIDYMTDLTRTPMRQYFRPNFWPNTPDILPEYLQYGGRAAFVTRFILAATLSSNYGIYGPAFELCVHEALTGKEEYLDSEKYEIKSWNREQKGNLVDLITRVNEIRNENSAFQTTWNIQFCPIENESLLAYVKFSQDEKHHFLVIVNLDPVHQQSGWVELPLEELGIDPSHTFMVYDRLSQQKFIWEGRRNYVELDPHRISAHIFEIHSNLHREQEFDYFL